VPGPHQWRGVIAEYREWLPVHETTTVISLGEGGTPLVRADSLSQRLGSEVWVKVEGTNPTGSFKDRGMTVAMSVAVSTGAKAVVCASTGNTSASMAAYAAKAGIRAIVCVPEGRIARGKLAQAIVHGARIVAVRGGFDSCLEMAVKLAESYPVALVNSVNRVRIEGQKTAAFEIVDVLGDAPDIHVLPVGNAGNIAAYWQGYREYASAGHASRTPRMFGFQAAGAAPIVGNAVVSDPQTVASAIRVGNPASWDLATTARDDSGGIIEAVTDEQILDAQAELAALEGIFVEPASASGIAGLTQLAAQNRLPAGQRIVVTVTGHGLKDVDTALEHAGTAVVVPSDVDADAVAAAAGLA
jgi:threonine synthase